MWKADIWACYRLSDAKDCGRQLKKPLQWRCSKQRQFTLESPNTEVLIGDKHHCRTAPLSSNDDKSRRARSLVPIRLLHTNPRKPTVQYLKVSSEVDLLRALVVRLTAAATGLAAADASILAVAPEAKLLTRPLLPGWGSGMSFDNTRLT